MGRVLLVDDDKSVLFTLNEVMLDRGHEPITAASAEEGLAKLDAVDVAIIDLAMPGMDGLALLRAMRARRVAAGDHAHRARVGARRGGGHQGRRVRLHEEAVRHR